MSLKGDKRQHEEEDACPGCPLLSPLQLAAPSEGAGPGKTPKRGVCSVSRPRKKAGLGEAPSPCRPPCGARCGYWGKQRSSVPGPYNRNSFGNTKYLCSKTGQRASCAGVNSREPVRATCFFPSTGWAPLSLLFPLTILTSASQPFIYRSTSPCGI